MASESGSEGIIKLALSKYIVDKNGQKRRIIEKGTASTETQSPKKVKIIRIPNSTEF